MKNKKIKIAYLLTTFIFLFTYIVLKVQQKAQRKIIPQSKKAQ